MLAFRGSKCSVGSGQEIGIPVIGLLLLDLRATDIGDSLLDVEINTLGPFELCCGILCLPVKKILTLVVLFVCFKEGRLGC